MHNTDYMNANLNKTLSFAHVLYYIIPKNENTPIIPARRELIINEMKKNILGNVFTHRIVIIEIGLKPRITYDVYYVIF
jgi:hypothetical protein